MFRSFKVLIVLLFAIMGTQRIILRGEIAPLDIDQLEHLRCGAPPCIALDAALCENLNSRDCDGGDCLEASGGSELYCDISEQLENVKGLFPVCKRADEGRRDKSNFEIACWARFVCSSYCEPDGEGGMVCSHNDSYPPYAEEQHMASACEPAGPKCPGGYIVDNTFNRYQLIASANGL